MRRFFLRRTTGRGDFTLVRLSVMTVRFFCTQVKREQVVLCSSFEDATKFVIDWVYAKGGPWGGRREVLHGKGMSGSRLDESREIGIRVTDGTGREIRVDFDPVKAVHINASRDGGRERLAALVPGPKGHTKTQIELVRPQRKLSEAEKLEEAFKESNERQKLKELSRKKANHERLSRAQIELLKQLKRRYPPPGVDYKDGELERWIANFRMTTRRDKPRR